MDGSSSKQYFTLQLSLNLQSPQIYYYYYYDEEVESRKGRKDFGANTYGTITNMLMGIWTI